MTLNKRKRWYHIKILKNKINQRNQAFLKTSDKNLFPEMLIKSQKLLSNIFGALQKMNSETSCRSCRLAKVETRCLVWRNTLLTCILSVESMLTNRLLLLLPFGTPNCLLWLSVVEASTQLFNLNTTKSHTVKNKISM